MTDELRYRFRVVILLRAVSYHEHYRQALDAWRPGDRIEVQIRPHRWVLAA